ncbi:hypothetical protein LTR62_007495 [Meristemomyces frigidus]|uniref:Nuclear distribution protein RO10 n=1 Tax=Meristemomyces frigidus TaxID=1508187 RepID=A0AAN7YMD9_9PEZI|nr:hypothetical protein LTR62_007495 [Meristemomyces frigidus]
MTAGMAATSKQAATETLDLLEDRLRRVQYILNGDSAARDTTLDKHATTTTSALSRLHHLERTLQQLTVRSPAVAEVLALHKSHPSLFHPTSPSTPTLSAAELAALVLSHTKLITTNSTNLSNLASTPISDPAPLTKLISLRQRIEAVSQKQDEHARGVAELRTRSARIVEHWVEQGCLGMGDKWAEWEERLRGMEIAVRRREGARRREEGIV